MKTKILLIPFICISLLLTSCLGDLDVSPLDENTANQETAYSDETSYRRGLMKMYSVFAMSGQDGEGSSDITGMDPGNTQLLRSWWIVQEVTTDECLNSWADDSWVAEINGLQWTNAKNESIEGVYQRCMYIVALANEYLRQTTESKVKARGGSDQLVQTVNGFRNEARFTRALAYYILMDAFARPPFITEDSYSMTPSQMSRADLFAWIEGELKDLATALPAPRTFYGRADQAVANALLSRMYLNSETYTGIARYTECIAASNAVINAGYTLGDNYSNLFKADNGITSKNEIIFPICFEGSATKTWGGMTFLICSSRGGSECDINTDGVASGWDGNRARPELVRKFEFSNPKFDEDSDAASIKDKRGIFFTTEDRTLEINEWEKTFATQGWAVYKYSNVNSDGSLGSDSQFPDTDFPLFRLGEIYLNYAEAVKRGGAGGSEAQAVEYINKLRERGYGNASGNINAGQMTLDFILDERARELYWEGVRRTDLVRYDYFTTNKYLWAFKGGIKNGVEVGNYKNIFPIPLSDLSANSNLTQNDGYSN